MIQLSKPDSKAKRVPLQRNRSACGRDAELTFLAPALAAEYLGATKKRKEGSDGKQPADEPNRPANVERISPSESDLEPVINTALKNVPEDEAKERPRSWWKKDN